MIEMPKVSKKELRVSYDSPYIMKQKLKQRIGWYLYSITFLMLTIMGLALSTVATKNQWLFIVLIILCFGLPIYLTYRSAYRTQIIISMTEIAIRTFKTSKIIEYNNILKVGKITIRESWFSITRTRIVKHVELQLKGGSEYKLQLANYNYLEALAVISHIKSRITDVVELKI